MTYDPRLVERRWRVAWDRAGCFRTPRRPSGPKYFNYDSGPFPNGPLHMGHVRTYVLGDATARHQRLLGKSVLYATEWDAFGLPIELAALETGVAPRAFVDRWIRILQRNLRALGISYDWSRVRSTCEPAYVRGTQRLFLDFHASGLVERREAVLPFCPSCATHLARMQIDRDGRCWRCATRTETRSSLQWFVLLSRWSERLRDGLARLDGWSESATRLLGGFIGSTAGPQHVHDWMISRQRSWGTPIPVVHCPVCGPVLLDDDAFPLLVPDDLPWGERPHPLADHRSFVETACPRCAASATRETDTLDCFFDDIWCFLAGVAGLRRGLTASRRELADWLPVDRFHAGFDTFFYLHLHRFLGAVLHERGVVTDPELIRGYIGHEMVLSAGRKMSTHLGNSVPASSVLERHGADALRVGILWAAGPHRAIEWREEIVEKAARMLGEVHELYSLFAASCLGAHDGIEGEASRAAREMRSRAEGAFDRVGRFLDEYRMNAAVDEIASLYRTIRAFAAHRIKTGRLGAFDAAVLRGVLADAAIALSPLAPHLAEECRSMLGLPPFAACARWPGRARRQYLGQRGRSGAPERPRSGGRAGRGAGIEPAQGPTVCG